MTMCSALKLCVDYRSHAGLFEFTRLPQGLRNAGTSFQHLMHEVLRGLTFNKCFVYFDDVIIFTK